MRIPFLFLAASATLSMSGGSAASADPWKEEGWKSRWRSDDRGYYGQYAPREFKEEYRADGCKVERKWKAGEYKEEVKCR